MSAHPFWARARVRGLPLARDIALKWAQYYDFPLPDNANLIKVAQFLAVDQQDVEFPKLLLQQEFDRLPGPDFNNRDEIHAVLAELPLPIYITTNYDSFMVQALESRAKRPPASPRFGKEFWNAIHSR